MEVWRRDLETGRACSLKLTVAGLKAIALDKCSSQSMPSTGVPNTNDGASEAMTGANVTAVQSATTPRAATAPRQGTKIARVIELLQRDQGANLDELIAATGWLPHTARAAMTGLRHRATTSGLSAARTGAPQSTGQACSSRRPRDRHAIEPEELGAAAEQLFGRRAGWTDRRRVWWSRPERPRGAAERSGNRGQSCSKGVGRREPAIGSARGLADPQSRR